MDKEQLENLINPLLKTYDSIELDLIRNILNRLENYSDISGSLKWYLEKLKDLKLLNKDNLEVINKNKKEIEKILKNILESAGNNIEDYDRLESYYNDGLIDVNPAEIFNSKSMSKVMSEALKSTKDITELINTKAIEGANKRYKDILNKAYIETSSDIYTYTESIRRALKDMAYEGIEIVHYESGRKISIEGAVRRDVTTRVNKYVGDVELQRAYDLNTNYVYVTQHLGARVRTKYMKHDYEAHAEWQGKKYMLDGSSEEYPNFFETTGYGEMLGLKGINCYHHFYPTWEWEKIEERIDESKNKEVYERMQKQRAFERKSRCLKREQLIAKQQQDNELITKNREKFAKFNEEYNKFIKDNKITRDYSREYIDPGKNNISLRTNDISSIESPKKRKVESYGDEIYNKYVDDGYEHLGLINNKTGEKIGNITTSNLVYGVDYSNEQLYLMNNYNRELTMIHTHPSNVSFSLEDIYEMFDKKAIRDILVETPSYEYYLTPNKEDMELISQNMKEFKQWMNKEMGEIRDSNMALSESDFRHKAFNELFNERLKWKYGRKKK